MAVELPELPDEPEHRGIAVLLAVAALFAAILGARASFLSGEASGHWQQAVREQLKVSAAVEEDVRYVYETQAPQALAVAIARVRAETYAAAAETATEPARSRLLVNAAAQRAIVDQATQNFRELLPDPRFTLPSGAVDLPRVLAEKRSRSPDILAIDVAATVARGDRASTRALGTLGSTVPIGVTFLLGAFAQAFPRWRRPLLVAGGVTLALGVVAAIVVQVAW